MLVVLHHMRASYRLAGQFGVAALIAMILGVLTALIGVWTIGLPPETAQLMIPPAYRPALFVFAFSGLLVLMTAALFIAAVVESLLKRGGRSAEQDTAPNSRPPSQLPPSLEVQSSDSQRTPSSGGCG